MEITQRTWGTYAVRRLWKSLKPQSVESHAQRRGNPIGQGFSFKFSRFSDTRLNKTPYRNRVRIVFTVTNIIKRIIEAYCELSVAVLFATFPSRLTSMHRNNENGEAEEPTKKQPRGAAFFLKTHRGPTRWQKCGLPDRARLRNRRHSWRTGHR